MNVLERKKVKFRSFRVLQFQLWNVKELTFLTILIILIKGEGKNQRIDIILCGQIEKDI